MITCSRYHDISCGHRVVGHEGKCRNLHGHNYRITFTCCADLLDAVGRVIDFSVMKDRLCMWVENTWDHKMLLWSEDPGFRKLQAFDSSIIKVDFNPTAENIAQFLLRAGPRLLDGTGVALIKVQVDETRKCSATAEINKWVGFS